MGKTICLPTLAGGDIMKVFFSAEDNSGDAFFFSHFFCCATAYFSLSCHMFTLIYMYRVIVVLGFYVSPTAKVIRRRGLGLKSHPKHCHV